MDDHRINSKQNERIRAVETEVVNLKETVGDIRRIVENMPSRVDDLITRKFDEQLQREMRYLHDYRNDKTVTNYDITQLEEKFNDIDRRYSSIKAYVFGAAATAGIFVSVMKYVFDLLSK